MVDFDLPDVASLPEGYCIRPLCYGDYDRGVLSVLEELAPVGEVTRTAFARYLHYIKNHREVHYTLVIVDKGDRVVAVGTLLIEPKLIHRCGLVGRVEDIAVARDEQGRGLGTAMLHVLDTLAERKGAYKNVLNCSRFNEPYYHKRGYTNVGYSFRDHIPNNRVTEELKSFSKALQRSLMLLLKKKDIVSR